MQMVSISQAHQDCNNRHGQQLMARKHDGGWGYYSQSNPQFIAHKHNRGVKQVNTELVPDIVLEEKEELFYQWADNYDVWNDNPYTPTKWNEMGGPIHLMLTPVFSILPKPNITGNWRQELWVKYLRQISRIFTSANVNHKYRTFEANY